MAAKTVGLDETQPTEEAVPARSIATSDDEFLARYLANIPDEPKIHDDPVGYSKSNRRLRTGATVKQKQLTVLIIFAFAVLVGLAIGLPTSEPGAILPITFLVGIVLIVQASLWLVFAKVGYPGWFSLVPVLNLVILHDIADVARWKCIFYFAPILLVCYFAIFPFPEVAQFIAMANLVNSFIVLVVWASVCRGLADSFGHGILFALGLLFLGGIFFPILGFGNSELTT